MGFDAIQRLSYTDMCAAGELTVEKWGLCVHISSQRGVR